MRIVFEDGLGPVYTTNGEQKHIPITGAKVDFEGDETQYYVLDVRYTYIAPNVECDLFEVHIDLERRIRVPADIA